MCPRKHIFQKEWGLQRCQKISQCLQLVSVLPIILKGERHWTWGSWFPTATERVLSSDRDILSAFTDSCEIFPLNLPTSFLLIPSSLWDGAFLMTNWVWGANKSCCIFGKSLHFILLTESHEGDSCRAVPKSPTTSGCTKNTKFLYLWSWWPDLWAE